MRFKKGDRVKLTCDYSNQLKAGAVGTIQSVLSNDPEPADYDVRFDATASVRTIPESDLKPA
jgi:hypothetical protein